MHVVTQEVAPQPVERGPDDASCCIEEQKALPPHAVGPGQECRPGAQHGDKAPEEDDFAAMPHEKILPQLQPAFLEANIAPIAPQQTVATLAPDPEAEIIPQDRPTGRRRDHHWNGELVRRPGIDGSHQEHGLTRKRDAGALNGHKDQDRPIPIGGEQMHQVRCRDMKHVLSAFSISDAHGTNVSRRFTSGTACHGKPLP